MLLYLELAPQLVHHVLRQRGKVVDEIQGVFDLVRDARGERSERGELLLYDELFLGLAKRSQRTLELYVLPAQVTRALVDLVLERAAVLGELGCGALAGRRGLAQVFDRPLEVAPHPPEGGRESADLVGTVDGRQRAVEIAAGDGVARSRQRDERAGHGAGDPGDERFQRLEGDVHVDDARQTPLATRAAVKRKRVRGHDDFAAAFVEVGLGPARAPGLARDLVPVHAKIVVRFAAERAETDLPLASVIVGREVLRAWLEGVRLEGHGCAVDLGIPLDGRPDHRQQLFAAVGRVLERGRQALRNLLGRTQDRLDALDRG